jgi:D-amino peptidase
MMEGIDSSFAAVIFIGYHASTSSTTGVRAHTMSSALLTRIALNGVSMSEAGVNAAIAAQFGVPVVMITGDDAIVDETKQRLGGSRASPCNTPSAFTRRPRSPRSRHSADPPARQDGRRASRSNEAVRDARPVGEVSFKNYRPVELLGYLPNVQRIDSHTVRFSART